MKMHKGKATIEVSGSWNRQTKQADRVPLEVDALLSKHYAIHRTPVGRDWTGEAIYKFAKSYTVSHIRTGRAVVQFVSLKVARSVVERAERLGGANFGTFGHDEGASKRFIAGITRIARSARP